MADHSAGGSRERVLETRSLETAVACPTCGGRVQGCASPLVAECRRCRHRVALTEVLVQ
jgi:DNA-directed RNA polymerase subunit RPC12/RpoP